MSDISTYEEYLEKAQNEFRAALPYFEQAHELAPDDRGILSALLQITIQLDDMDKYTLYKQKKAVLEN